MGAWQELISQLDKKGFVVIDNRKSLKGAQKTTIVAAHRKKLILCATNKGDERLDKIRVYGCITYEQEAEYFRTSRSLRGSNFGGGSFSGPKNGLTQFDLGYFGDTVTTFFSGLQKLKQAVTFVDWKGVNNCATLDNWREIRKSAPNWVRSFTD